MTEAMKWNYHSAHLLEMVEYKQPLNSSLLEKVDISIRDKKGRNALYWAIKNHSKHNVSLLLEQNIPLIVEIDNNLHALFHAIDSTNLEVFGLFIELGIDINIQDKEGKSLLMKAIEKESMVMLQYLINKGIDIDLMDNNYDMAIDYAKRCKNKQVFELLHYKILNMLSQSTQSNCSSCGCGFGQETLCAAKKEF